METECSLAYSQGPANLVPKHCVIFRNKLFLCYSKRDIKNVFEVKVLDRKAIYNAYHLFFFHTVLVLKFNSILHNN